MDKLVTEIPVMLGGAFLTFKLLEWGFGGDRGGDTTSNVEIDANTIFGSGSGEVIQEYIDHDPTGLGQAAEEIYDYFTGDSHLTMQERIDKIFTDNDGQPRDIHGDLEQLQYNNPDGYAPYVDYVHQKWIAYWTIHPPQAWIAAVDQVFATNTTEAGVQSGLDDLWSRDPDRMASLTSYIESKWYDWRASRPANTTSGGGVPAGRGGQTYGGSSSWEDWDH